MDSSTGIVNLAVSSFASPLRMPAAVKIMHFHLLYFKEYCNLSMLTILIILTILSPPG